MVVATPLTISGWLRYDVVRRLLPTGRPRLLEIGVGRGAFGSRIAPHVEYVGLEPDPGSFAIARESLDGRGELRNVLAEDYAPAAPFDVVCAFEVMEHIEDDVSALRGWSELARPGGQVIVSVPAGSLHFGEHDRLGGHFRRYDRPDLERVFSEAGLTDVRVIAYGFPIGYAIMAGLHLIARRSAIREQPMETRTLASGGWMQPRRVTGRLRRVVALPFVWVQRPFARTSLGIGFVACGRKP